MKEDENKHGISVIIPVKPPEPYLSSLVENINEILRSIPHEVLIQTEVGLTNAVIEGVKKSHYDTIAVMDADGSHDPFYLPKMLELIDEYDLVVGSKALGKDETSFLRRLTSKIYRWFAQTLLTLGITDPMSGFVVGRKTLFLSLKPSTDYKFLLQLLVNNPAQKITEIPIIFQKRQGGESKATFHTGLNTFYSIIKFWWITFYKNKK